MSDTTVSSYYWNPDTDQTVIIRRNTPEGVSVTSLSGSGDAFLSHPDLDRDWLPTTWGALLFQEQLAVLELRAAAGTM